MACKVKECTNVVHVQKEGLCQKHYLRLRRHGDVNYTGNRRSNKCAVILTGGAQCKNIRVSGMSYCWKHCKMLRKSGRLDLSNKELREYCSRPECKNKKTGRRGICDKHLAEERIIGNSSKKAQLQGLPAFQRQWLHEQSCTKCGWNDAHRDVHHITAFDSNNVKYSNRLSNLVVLCPNCHRMAHEGSISKTTLKNYAKLTAKQIPKKHTACTICGLFFDTLRGQSTHNAACARSGGKPSRRTRSRHQQL